MSVSGGLVPVGALMSPTARSASTLDALVRRRLAAYLDAMTARPTQGAIGGQIGRTQTWVSHYLAGRIDADLDTLNRICEFIGIKLSDVISEALRAKPGAARTPAAAQVQTLFAAITPEEQQTVLDVLSTLARRPSSRRARDKRKPH